MRERVEGCGKEGGRTRELELKETPKRADTQDNYSQTGRMCVGALLHKISGLTGEGWKGEGREDWNGFWNVIWNGRQKAGDWGLPTRIERSSRQARRVRYLQKKPQMTPRGMAHK